MDERFTIDRVVTPSYSERLMSEVENRELGSKLMEYLYEVDAPVVVQVHREKYRGGEVPPYYHVRTWLDVKKVESMDIRIYTSSLSELNKKEIKKDRLSQITTGAVILLVGFLVSIMVYGIVSGIYSLIVR